MFITWEAFCKENLYPTNGQDGIIALMRVALIQWSKESRD